MGRQTAGDTCNLNIFPFQGWSWKKSKFNLIFFFKPWQSPLYSQSFSEFMCVEASAKPPSLFSGAAEHGGWLCCGLSSYLLGALPLIFRVLIRAEHRFGCPRPPF